MFRALDALRDGRPALASLAAVHNVFHWASLFRACSAPGRRVVHVAPAHLRTV